MFNLHCLIVFFLVKPVQLQQLLTAFPDVGAIFHVWSEFSAHTVFFPDTIEARDPFAVSTGHQ